MTSLSGKHVLILGSAMGLGEALYQQFELGNLPASQFNFEKLVWREAKTFRQQILKSTPSLVVNALPLDLLQADVMRCKELTTCIEAALGICQAAEIKILQLSSAAVFADNDKKSYDETEKPQPLGSSIGKNLLICEEALSGDPESSLLLRLADILNTDDDNNFTRWVSELIHQEKIFVDPSIRMAPIWLDDALRVVASLVRQILSGAENWGVFHYASADPCTQREFVQQLADSLADIKPGFAVQIVNTPADQQQKQSSVLKCRRIRNNFGVHGRTWRQGLKSRLKFWLDSQEQDRQPELVTLSSAGGD